MNQHPRWCESIGLFLTACGLLWPSPGSSSTAASPDGKQAWTTLEHCRLVPNEYNDGDSFHVRSGNQEYIFRLYFVDAPEDEADLKFRLLEQSDYFGIDSTNVMALGRDAADFTANFLRGEFTVITKWHGGQGRSKLPRYYGIVKVGSKDLGEALVDHGLARVFGVRTTLPDGSPGDEERSRLLKIEDQAREQRRGAWLESKRHLIPNMPELQAQNPGEKLIVTPRTVATYSLGEPRHRLGEVLPGTVVHITEEYPDGWCHVHYELPTGGIEEAFCLRWDLSLPDI